MKTKKILILLTIITTGLNAQTWSVTTSGNIYYNSGNVGIGNSNPEYGVDMRGQNNNESGIRSTATNGGSSSFTLVAYTPLYSPVPSYKNKTVLQTLDNPIALSAYGTNSNNQIQFYTGGRTDAFKRMVLDENGNLGIGATNRDAKLTVAGNIHSREVKVTINAGADFVFENGYNLWALSEIEEYIKKNKHLPNIESGKVMEEEGLELGKMDIKLLRKIEELTLYTIQQQKEIEILKKENKEIKISNKKFSELQLRLEKLESKE